MKTFQNTANLVWMVLAVATGVTYWLGQRTDAIALGLMPVLVMFGLAFFKGALVVDYFMGLRQAPVMWRRLLWGWLGVVISLIVLAYWIGFQK